jgi:hypothetical protein
MSEKIQLPDTLFKLIVRFSNGEMINYIVAKPLDSRAITPETRYAVIASFPIDSPNECTDISLVNLRDVTFVKTERVTLEQLSHDRRMAGIRSGGSSDDEKTPKTLAHLTFV